MALKYDDRFDKLELKLDKLDTRLDDVQILMTKQQGILDEHIKRTTQVEDALIPLKAQQNQIIGAIKLVSVLGVISSIIAAFIKFRG